MDSFAEALLDWFDVHGRSDLPWKQAATPYRVWVSEIMLQQTQVSTVIPYFERFMARFPELSTLAAAPVDEVLHHWTGLGYYARARNLHTTAQIVNREHGGELPKDIDVLQSLPGIGRSTAGAILAQACAQRQPILDGNVKRVLARYHAVEGWPGQAAVLRRLWQHAEVHTPYRRVADYTQAIMDLGAMVCVHHRPLCDACPLAAECEARSQARQHELPTPRPKKQIPERETVMLIARNPEGEFWMVRRPPSGVWGGLWAFPEFPSKEEAVSWCASELGPLEGEIQAWNVVSHAFSHFRLHITPLLVSVQNPEKRVMEADGQVWYNTSLSPPGGFAAPVKRLIERLRAEQTGASNGSHGAMRQAG